MSLYSEIKYGTPASVTPDTKTRGAMRGAASFIALRELASPMYCSASDGAPILAKYTAPDEEWTRGRRNSNVASGSIVRSLSSRSLSIWEKSYNQCQKTNGGKHVTVLNEDSFENHQQVVP